MRQVPLPEWPLPLGYLETDDTTNWKYMVIKPTHRKKWQSILNILDKNNVRYTNWEFIDNTMYRGTILVSPAGLNNLSNTINRMKENAV